jgi:hypothetical protein
MHNMPLSIAVKSAVCTVSFPSDALVTASSTYNARASLVTCRVLPRRDGDIQHSGHVADTIE